MRKKEECKSLLGILEMLNNSLSDAQCFLINSETLCAHFKGKIKYLKQKIKAVETILDDEEKRDKWEELMSMIDEAEAQKKEKEWIH